MLRKFIFFALAFVFIGLFAQEQKRLKPRIIINTFERANNVSSSTTDILRQKTVEAIIESNRFVLMDKELLESVKEEESRRSQERAMGDATARSEQVTEAAYNYILEGKALDYDMSSSTNKDGKVTYTCKIRYTLTFVDVATTTAMASSTFEIKGYGSNKDDAYSSAVRDVKGNVNSFLIKQLPLTGSVIPLDYEVHKNKITYCYIDLGSDHGAKEGQYYEIQASQIRAGRHVYTYVARLKIIEVVDGQMSHCKITKDGKDFYKGMESFLSLDEKEQKKYSFRVVQSEREDPFGIFNL